MFISLKVKYKDNMFRYFGFVLITIVYCHGTEGISEERFLKLERLVESQNARINDLEKTVKDQHELIENLYQKLRSVPKTNDLETNDTSTSITSTSKTGSTSETQLPSDEVPLTKSLGINKNRIQPSRNIHQIQQEKRLLLQNQPMQSQRVGFYAYMSQNEDSPSKHHTVIFDILKSQVGNGYNANSGMFTAPQDGVYVFSSSICMVHAYGSYDIVKNSDVQGTFFVDSANNSEWRYATTTILVTLAKGDVVFVRTSTSYQPHGDIRSNALGRSSFVGYLLQ